MSDETRIEDEDTEDVEAHGRIVFGRPSEADDDSEDVEAHGKLSSKVASQVRSADAEGDDDVQAHIRLS
jgi:hypothetical protein